jgi:hypothetical protein
MKGYHKLKSIFYSYPNNSNKHYQTYYADFFQKPYPNKFVSLISTHTGPNGLGPFVFKLNSSGSFGFGPFGIWLFVLAPKLFI